MKKSDFLLFIAYQCAQSSGSFIISYCNIFYIIIIEYIVHWYHKIHSKDQISTTCTYVYEIIIGSIMYGYLPRYVLRYKKNKKIHRHRKKSCVPCES